MRLDDYPQEFPLEKRTSFQQIPCDWERGNWLCLSIAHECTKIVAISTFMGTHSLVNEVETVKLSEMC